MVQRDNTTEPYCKVKALRAIASGSAEWSKPEFETNQLTRLLPPPSRVPPGHPALRTRPRSLPALEGYGS